VALRGQYRSGDGCTYNGTAYFDAREMRSLTRRWMYAAVV
jgi:phage-related protein